MIQNCLENEYNEPKLVRSDDLSTQLSDSSIHSQKDEKTIKKVKSLNSDVIKKKRTSIINDKTFKVKLTNYKNMQKNFNAAFNNLIKSYEAIKDLMPEKKDLEIEKLDTVVNII